MLNAKGMKAVLLRKKYPDMRTSEIGRRVGLTRERVRQILLAQGLPTTIPKSDYHCQYCEKLVTKATKTCMDCIRERAWMVVNCAACGKDTRIRTSTHRYRQYKSTKYKGNYYCDRTCFYSRKNPFSGDEDEQPTKETNPIKRLSQKIERLLNSR